MSNAGLILAGVSLLLNAIIIMVEVIVRKLFNGSIYITTEFSGYLLAAIIFLSLGAVQKSRSHLKIEIGKNVFPEKIWNFLGFVFGLVLYLAFNLILLAITANYAFQTFENKTFSTNVLHTPLWIPQLLLLLGILIQCFQIIIQMFKFKEQLEEKS